MTSTPEARTVVVGTRVGPTTAAGLAVLAAERGVRVSALVAELCDAAVAASTPATDGPPHRWTSTHRGNVCAVCAQEQADAAPFCPGSRTRPK